MNTNQTNTSSSQLYGDMIKNLKQKKGQYLHIQEFPINS